MGPRMYVRACPAENYSRLLREVYSKLPEETIRFEDRGSIAQDGSYEITLTEDSAPYLRGIICKIYRENQSIPVTYSPILDGEVDTYDTRSSRQNAKLTVNSTFRGDGVALDGHLLMLTVIPRRITSTYTAPICVNGEDTWYTFVRSKKDGVHSLVSVTLGNGQDEQGLPTRDVRQLQPGDRVSTYTSYDEKGEYQLKLYTDGVPEATDASGEMFGTERMISALNARPNAEPMEVLKNMRSAVDGFVLEAEQFDDLTMLCLEYKGSGPKSEMKGG